MPDDWEPDWQMCPDRHCCMTAGHGGDHWPGDDAVDCEDPDCPQHAKP
jgi:hypothetical protein